MIIKAGHSSSVKQDYKNKYVVTRDWSQST